MEDKQNQPQSINNSLQIITPKSGNFGKNVFQLLSYFKHVSVNDVIGYTKQ
jgi:hypothetical protein